MTPRLEIAAKLLAAKVAYRIGEFEEPNYLLAHARCAIRDALEVADLLLAEHERTKPKADGEPA